MFNMREFTLKSVSILLSLVINTAALADEAAKVGLMSKAELERFSKSFDPVVLERLFGRSAGLAAIAELDRKTLLGPRYYDVYINGAPQERQRVVLVEAPNSEIDAEIPAVVIMSSGLNFSNPDLPDSIAGLSVSDVFLASEIGSIVPGAVARILNTEQRIEISIPSSWMKRSNGTIAPQKLWDWGKTGFVSNYDLNVQQNDYAGRVNRHFYGALDSRLNIGVWRVVADASISWDSSEEEREEHIDVNRFYATRIWPESKTRVKAGSFSTSGFFGPGVQLRGIEMHVDPSMMDRDEMSFAPVIVGTAYSQARVTVSQRGRVVYERHVSPGSFRLEGLPALFSSGDLEVVVVEADGSRRSFVVPYTSNYKQIRTGKFKWSVAAGVLDDAASSDAPAVLAFDAGWGAPLDSTLYAAGTIAREYQQFRIGSAMQIPFAGSFNLELIHSNDSTRGGWGRGVGAAASLTRYVDQTGSFLSLKAEKTLSGIQTDVHEAYSLRSGSWLELSSPEDFIIQVSMTQSLDSLGSLNLSYDRRTTMNGRTYDSLSGAYSTKFGPVNLSVSVQKTSSYSDQNDDLVVSVNAVVPLSSFSSGFEGSSSSLGLGASKNGDGGWDERVFVSGTAMKQSRLSYSMQAANSYDGSQRFDGSLQYKANRAEIGVMGGVGRSQYSAAASLRGAVVASEKGLLFTEQVEGPSVFAEFKNVPEARLRNHSTATIVKDGVFASNFNNYEFNEIGVDIDELPLNVSMPVYVKKVVPADDALIFVDFTAFRGEQVLARFRTQTGLLPFGALVEVRGGDASSIDGIIDEDGSAYFASAPIKGVFEASWRDEDGIHACRAPYDLSSRKAKRVHRLNLLCSEEAE